MKPASGFRAVARQLLASTQPQQAATCPRGISTTHHLRRPQRPLSRHQQQQQQRRPFTSPTARRPQRQAADDPNFQSIIDNPPELVRAGRKRHGPGLIILAVIPLTALALGTWQVKRLGWKTELIARLEDRLIREPLPLPPRVDPEAVADFDYRRVYAEGRYRHDREMLVGPRTHDGEDGYMVVTPLEREPMPDGTTTSVLVNRGWISKSKRDQRSRPESLFQGDVVVEGLLREPWKKNMFTPVNRPDKGEFYFPDVEEMATLGGSQPVWVEQTMEPTLLQAVELRSKGIPIGRAPEVNVRNNHAQYIFTWYGLALATSIMFYMVVKKPQTNIARQVRHNKDWS